MPNNVAEFILRMTTEGSGEVKTFAADMSQIDQLAAKIAFSIASANAAQQKYNDALKQSHAPAQQATGNFLAMGGALSVVQQALGVGFSVGGLFMLANAAAQTVREIKQIGDIMDTDVQSASRLAYAVQSTGRSMDTLRMAAIYMNTALAAVRQPGGDRRNELAFGRLGIDPAEIKNDYDLLLKLSDAYRGNLIVGGEMVTQDQKTVAMKVILGRSFRELEPLLQMGSEEISKMKTVTAEQQAEAEKFLKTVHELKENLQRGIGLPIVEFVNANTAAIVLIASIAMLGTGVSAGTALWAKYAAALTAAQLTTAGMVAATTLELAIIIASAAAVYKAVSAWEDLRDAKFQELQSADALRTISEKLIRLYGDYKDVTHLTAFEIAGLTEAETKLYEIQLRRQVLALKGELWQQKDFRSKHALELQQQIREAYESLDAIGAKRAGLEGPVAGPINLPKPDEVKAEWKRVLEIYKSSQDEVAAQNQLAVDERLMSEKAAEQDKYQGMLGYNVLEQEALKQQNAALGRAHQAYLNGDATITKEADAKNLAEIADNNAKLTALAAANGKLQAEAKDKGLKFSLEASKEEMDIRIKMAEATGNQLLAQELKIDQEISALREKTKKMGITEIGGQPVDQQLDTLQSLMTYQAEFKNKVEETKAAIQEYANKIRDTNEAMQAGSISTTQGRNAIKGYEDAIHAAVATALPELQKLLAAIDELGKLHPELKIDTSKLQKSLREIQAENTKTFGTHTQTEVQQLQQRWGDLGKQLDHFTATTLQNFAQTAAHAFTGFIMGSQNAKEALRSFVASTIEGIMQIVIQQILAHTILAALQRMFGEETTTAATTAGAQSAAAWTPAAVAASIATLGGADVAGMIGFAIAMSAGMALSMGLTTASGAVGKAGGGYISGPGGPTDDMIPAWLSDGEYVLPAHLTSAIGVDRLDALRNATHRQGGGLMGGMFSSLFGGGGGGGFSIPTVFGMFPLPFASGGLARIRDNVANRSFSVGASSVPGHAFGSTASFLHSGAGGSGATTIEMPTIVVPIGDSELKRIHASEVGKNAFKAHVDVHATHIKKSQDRLRGHL